MRHRKRTNKLGRPSAPRRALFINLSKALIINGRIKTTIHKAKAVRGFLEPLITFAKRGDVAARRRIARDIGDRALVKKLCDDIAPVMADREGGYLRIVKIGPRKGDNAEMAYVELIGVEAAADQAEK